MHQVAHLAKSRLRWHTRRKDHAPIEDLVSFTSLLPATATACGGQAQAQLCKPGPPTTIFDSRPGTANFAGLDRVTVAVGLPVTLTRPLLGAQQRDH
eukprot:4542599-Heterocapsa_arctica.AAC.1